MKVSVVIPAYNEEKYIGRCLESLMNQKVMADEIIVVNNNSTDTTEDIVKKYPVRLVFEREKGMIHARNRGFNESQYDIIARTDSDSVADTSWIKQIKEFFTKNEEYDAVSGPSYYDTVPEYIYAPIFNQYIGSLHIILGHYPLVGPNLSLRNSMWKKIKNTACLDDTLVHEDIDLSIHIDQVGGVIGFDPSIKVYSSTRRLMENPSSFFLEYPHRVRKMLKFHEISVGPMSKIQIPEIKVPKFTSPFQSKKDGT